MARIPMPAFMGPTHPYHEHRGPWFERSFDHEVTRQRIEFKRDYLVGYWTDYMEEKVRGKHNKKRAGQQWHRRRAMMRVMLDELPDTPMFTVVQHDDGMYHPWPKNLTVFGAGGVGDVSVPLLMPTVKPDHDDRQILQRVAFMGKTRGPNNRFGVRQAMLEAFADRPEFTNVPVSSYSDYCFLIRHSAFTMCPAGYGLTSFRLYETLALGSVPVYIHNGTPWLPFQDRLDWDELAVLVAPKQIHELPDRLDAITERRRQEMLANIRTEFEEHFTMPGVVRRVRDWLEDHDVS